MPVLLALSLACFTALQEPVRPEPGRLQVLKGRVVLVGDAGVERTLGAGQEAELGRAVHVEVGSGAEARLSWPPEASVHVFGPSALEGRESVSEDGARRLAWRFLELSWADVEVRAGAHGLELPGGWHASLRLGAWHLRGVPSGPVELRHHAGGPVSLEWRGEGGRPHPPVAVYSGSSLRLERPERGASDSTAGTVPRVGAVPGRPERTAAEPRSLARVSEVPEPLRVRIESRALPQAPASGAPSENFWQGLSAESLRPAGPLAVQRMAGVEVRLTSGGSWKVLVPSDGRAPIWVFGPHADHRMHPGSIASFDADGRLRLAVGRIDTQPAPAGRPSPER